MPECRRCEKAGIACQGYGNTRIFVNRTLAEPRATAVSAISRQRDRSTRAALAPASTCLQNLQHLLIEDLNSSKSPLEFRTRAVALIKDLYLPRALAKAESTANHTATSWVHAISKLDRRSRALDRSLLAFCAIQAHLTEPKTVPLEAGLQLYNPAIQELVKSLENHEIRYDDETLAAIVVLSTCEVRSASHYLQTYLLTDSNW